MLKPRIEAGDEPCHGDMPPREDDCHDTRNSSGSQMPMEKDSEVFLNPRHHNEPPIGDQLVKLRIYENIRTPGHMASM